MTLSYVMCSIVISFYQVSLLRTEWLLKYRWIERQNLNVRDVFRVNAISFIKRVRYIRSRCGRLGGYSAKS